MIKSAILLPLLALGSAVAQLAPGTEGTSRLDQMEAIYQKELSARHIPLLGKYLTELQRQAATASTEDKPFYVEEIARIQEVISAGGALDLIAAQQTPNGQLPMPAPMPPPAPNEHKNALIVLTPAQSVRFEPSMPVDASSAVVTEAEWRIPVIEAGSYDVLLHYSCPTLPSSIPIKITFAGQTLEIELDPKKATKDAQSFRIIRVGSLTLTGEHRGETLRLSVGEKSQAAVLLKSVLVTKPRPSPN